MAKPRFERKRNTRHLLIDSMRSPIARYGRDYQGNLANKLSLFCLSKLVCEGVFEKAKFIKGLHFKNIN